MSVPRRRRADGAALAIGVLRLVLPARRKEWGDAARSELAALTSPSDRRRFSISCLRIVVADRATLRSVCAAASVAALLLVAAVSTAGITLLVARVEGIVLIAALAGLFLASRGGRPGAGRLGGWISPVDPGRAHRVVRVVGCLGSSALMLTLVVRSRTNPGLGPGTGTGTEAKPIALGILGLITLAMAASLLVITAKSAAISPRAVATGGACGLIAGLCWFGFVLAVGYVDAHTLGLASLIVVMGCAGSAAIFGPRGRAASAGGVQAGLLAAVLAVLLIFTGPMATYSLMPSTVPDPSPGSHRPQLNQYAHDEQDAVEAEDPYIVTFLVGGLLSMLLIGSVAARRRPSENSAILGELASDAGQLPI